MCSDQPRCTHRTNKKATYTMRARYVCMWAHKMFQQIHRHEFGLCVFHHAFLPFPSSMSDPAVGVVLGDRCMYSYIKQANNTIANHPWVDYYLPDSSGIKDRPMYHDRPCVCVTWNINHSHAVAQHSRCWTSEFTPAILTRGMEHLDRKAGYVGVCVPYRFSVLCAYDHLGAKVKWHMWFLQVVVVMLRRWCGGGGGGEEALDPMTRRAICLRCFYHPSSVHGYQIFLHCSFFSHKHRDAWWKGKKSEQHNNTHSNHKDNEYVCSGGGTKIRHKQCVHAHGTWHPRRGTADERTTWIHASLLLTAMKKGDHITHHIQGRLPSFSWFSRIVNIPAS